MDVWIVAALAAGLFVIGLAMVMTVFLGRSSRPQVTLPPNAILVDGSNVMHWGGTPSQLVLVRIVDDLCKRDFSPVVVFDASVGHRLKGRYLSGAQMADMLGLPQRHVSVVNKGVVADEVIIDLAQTHQLKVITNDRYRDWRVQFPAIARKGALVRGTWKQGNVVWDRPEQLR